MATSHEPKKANDHTFLTPKWLLREGDIQNLPPRDSIKRNGSLAKRPTSSANTASATAKKAKCESTPDSSGVKWTTQWRKKTNKKNKNWDGDGFATIRSTAFGCEITVKNSDGKVISKKSFNSGPDLDDVIPIGMYEIILDEKLGQDESDNVKPVEQVEEVVVAPKIVQTKFKKVVQDEVQETRKPLYEENQDKFTLTAPPNVQAHVPVRIDPILASKLRPHQLEGVTFLYECLMGFRNFKGNGCLLADEMGLGKTLMTITTIWTLMKQNPFPDQKKPVVNKVLVVCPVTLINNWRDEFKKWLGLNKVNVLTLNNPMSDDKRDIVNFGKLNVYQVLVINYEKLLAHYEELSTIPFDLLVCDEGHRLKNSANKVMINLTKLNIPKKIVLTGTPIQNYLVEFHTLVSFLNPHVLPDIKIFQKEFINPISRARDVNCFNQEIKMQGEEMSQKLISLTHKFILRRTQAILENYLTDKTDILLFVPPTQLQLDLFDSIKKSEKFQQLDSGAISLSLINLFRKICNSPSLLASDDFYKSISDGTLKLSSSSGKLNALIPLVLEIAAQQEKLVLISNYTTTLDLLETVIRKLNLQYLRLDGSTPNNMRSKLVNQFNKNDSISVFLLSSKSGGTGINLVGASRLILYDNDWNPSTDLQSMSRIHRDGQRKPCYIYRIFTTGCIDEKIFQRQLMKNKLSSKFLDNDSSSKSDVFDYSDLKNLFEINMDTKSNTHDLLGCSCAGDGFILSQEVEPESDEEPPATTKAWMSAAEFQQNVDKNGNSTTTKAVKKALNDYQHYSPELNPNLEFDSVLSRILNNKLFKDKSPFTYIMQKGNSK
ncbi:RDH54 [Candida margitis]|uniref:RDH54 n=1 Tax=Candida margitis TaxID=1775924 RepID=UPI0022272E8D|nr:RDH54 [Candida margitis]KAI5952938.1 RDH54 [Candida margitis]